MDTMTSESARHAPSSAARALVHVAALLGLLFTFACSGSDGGGGSGGNNTGGDTTGDAQPTNDGAGGTPDQAAPDGRPDVATGTGGAGGTGGSSGDAEAGPGGGGSSGNGGGDARIEGGGGDATPDRVVPPPDGMGGSGGSDAGPDASPDRAPTPDAAPDVFDAPADVPRDVPPDVPPDVPLPTGGYFTVVAHPDDDIIFMNPDLQTFNQSGSASCTVYVTSGDLGETQRGWGARERGILDAQAAMAGQSTQCLTNAGACQWQCGNATYSGHPVVRCTLSTAPLTAVFLRLPDSFIGRLWGPPAEPNPAMQLTSVSQIADAGTTATYTRQDLIDVLTAIMNETHPVTILTMDSTMAYNSNVGPGTFDHPDHMGSGFFTLAAAQAYHQYQSVRIYRGYTTLGAAPNLTQAQIDEKQRIFGIYGADNNGAPSCADYAECQRQIVYASLSSTNSVIRQGTLCLQDSGGDVQLVPCNAADATQQWSTTADARITASNGQCLTGGGTLTVTSCSANGTDQRWTWFETANGQLRGTNGSCVTQEDPNTIDEATCSSVNADSNPSAGVDPTQAWVTP